MNEEQNAPTPQAKRRQHWHCLAPVPSAETPTIFTRFSLVMMKLPHLFRAKRLQRTTLQAVRTF
jgi:hypothetical protein